MTDPEDVEINLIDKCGKDAPSCQLRPGFSGAKRALRRHLPPPNFITLHYAYFIGVCLISSVIFWGSSTPPRSVSYTDSLFFTVSAMTEAGLNTVNLSTLNTFQQSMLFLLIMLGSAILVSSVVVHVRKKFFEIKFRRIIEAERAKRRALRESSRERGSPFSFRRRSISDAQLPEVDGFFKRGRPILSLRGSEAQSGVKAYMEQEQTDGQDMDMDILIRPIRIPYLDHSQTEEKTSEDEGFETPQVDENHVRFASSASLPLRGRHHTRLQAMQGVGARPDILNFPRKAMSPRYPIPSSVLTEEKGDVLGTHKYFNSGGVIGRNSQFHSLTLAEREKLGGVEYRAIMMLEIIVPLYFILFQLFGCIGLGAWVAINRPDTATGNGLNPWWVGAFNAVSAFNNSGMSLIDANMVAFQTSDYMLITMSLLILAGNTCYPVFLRLILWTFYHLTPDNVVYHDCKVTLRFLLDHPRRCYTTLFPSTHTWWLLGTLVLLNGTDWAAFEILNLGNPVINSLPHGTRVIDGLFQAVAVRSGGFYVVPIANLRIGLLILYVIMMYISAYPVVITMRNSNVYEERSLGIYADDITGIPGNPETSFLSSLKKKFTKGGDEANEDVETASIRGGNQRPSGYFVRQQLRGQLAHDLWWIVLAVLLISITETSQFERDPADYSVFNVIFEVISAYSCVGISIGLPNVDYSFSGGWHKLSKLILCAVMIRGRHRGLPVAIDRAVMLPGEELGIAEEEDARMRMEKSMSRG